jgi:hypothetical protein
MSELGPLAKLSEVDVSKPDNLKIEIELEAFGGTDYRRPQLFKTSSGFSRSLSGDPQTLGIGDDVRSPARRSHYHQGIDTRWTGNPFTQLDWTLEAAALVL